jgi:hypothetical protein
MLSSELETRALHAIAAAFDVANWTFLGGALRPPVFAFLTADATLGSWQPTTRTLALSRRLVFERPWDHVVEVLKHEMAHQFAHEVLGARDERSHGTGFAFACRKFGIDPTATGPVQPSSAAALDPARRRAVERIHKLLALAASPNRNEAETAMRAARRKMLEHHIESPGTPPSGYATCTVGPTKARFHAWEKILGGLLGEHFFVRAIWIRNFIAAEGLSGDVLELSGSPEDLDVATYVHAFLTATGERLWSEHRRAAKLRSDRDRLRFIAGVMSGFASKLGEERTAEKAAGLVWVGDADLDGYVAQRHPKLRSVGIRVSGAGGFSEGRSAGRNVVLHKGVTAKGGGRGGLIGGPT